MQAEKMKIPLQGHFGRHDTFFPIKVSCCKPAQKQKFALHATTQACLRFLHIYKFASSPSLPAASIDSGLSFVSSMLLCAAAQQDSMVSKRLYSHCLAVVHRMLKHLSRSAMTVEATLSCLCMMMLAMLS